MKTVFKNILYVLLSIWHCIVSYFTFFCWCFGVYFIFDKTSDEYPDSILIGLFILVVWMFAYIPSCIVLSKKLYSYKKNIFMALIPIAVTLLFVGASLLYIFIYHMNNL